jgi:hypothetical protein
MYCFTNYELSILTVLFKKKDAILKISHLPVFFIAINKKEVI